MSNASNRSNVSVAVDPLGCVLVKRVLLACSMHIPGVSFNQDSASYSGDKSWALDVAAVEVAGVVVSRANGKDVEFSVVLVAGGVDSDVNVTSNSRSS